MTNITILRHDRYAYTSHSVTHQYGEVTCSVTVTPGPACPSPDISSLTGTVGGFPPAGGDMSQLTSSHTFRSHCITFCREQRVYCPGRLQTIPFSSPFSPQALRQFIVSAKKGKHYCPLFTL
ncbi:hypothetical protein BaRGS_00000415 [Batillaria attramentaria]|uniref:Uncharacterized protein n=1 Tax=Batillaria attramentaria TaxID=370345 RepID=A0ABD0M9Y3_9CAEN